MIMNQSELTVNCEVETNLFSSPSSWTLISTASCVVVRSAQLHVVRFFRIDRLQNTRYGGFVLKLSACHATHIFKFARLVEWQCRITCLLLFAEAVKLTHSNPSYCSRNNSKIVYTVSHGKCPKVWCTYIGPTPCDNQISLITNACASSKASQAECFTRQLPLRVPGFLVAVAM